MIGFEYKYNTPTEILRNMPLMSDYSLLEYGILIFIIASLIGLIHFGLPTLNLWKHYKKDTHDKAERKKFIRQIALQKDIEHEIEEELDI